MFVYWHARLTGLTLSLAFFVLTALASMATAAEPVVIGWFCDRTGATQLVGVNMCLGAHDYVKLINARGGIAGHPVQLVEVEHGYEVPRSVEGYESMKRAGVLSVFSYGTPITYALTPRYNDDKISAITPGFGRSDATDGKRFPYIFPVAASYWSQAGAAVKFVLEA